MNNEVVKLKMNKGECGKNLCQIALKNLGGIPERENIYFELKAAGWKNRAF